MALEIPEILRPGLAAPVAIFGGGVSGEAVGRLLSTLGVASATYDAKGTPFTAEAARRHRLVVISPGFAAGHPWLALARAGGAGCFGELDFASLFWKGRIVAVTGTNGKTTLTEFLVHALRKAGRDAHAAGNIGRAFCAVILDTAGGSDAALAVCEVSSFQGETLRHLRAAATLWTNFAEDHLERHDGMLDYFRAKASLARRSGALFAGASVRAYAQRHKAAAALLAGTAPIEWVRSEGQPLDPRLEGTVFAGYPQYENFLLAAAWWRASGSDPAVLLDAARDFLLGPHRFARVGAKAGVTYWNDSKATNFHAVEAALGRFESPVLLIAGGKAKGGDIAAFAARIAPRVRRAYLIGETAPALAGAFDALGISNLRCATLGEAVRAAAADAHPGDNILLSPAFASFDMFRGYDDRGAQFEQLAREQMAAPAAPPLLSR